MANEIILKKAGSWLAVLLVIALLTGCTTTRYEYVRYPCPPRPVLPTISAAELEILSDEAYAALVRRDVALMGYARLLEVHCAAHR